LKVAGGLKKYWSCVFVDEDEEKRKVPLECTFHQLKVKRWLIPVSWSRLFVLTVRYVMPIEASAVEEGRIVSTIPSSSHAPSKNM